MDNIRRPVRHGDTRARSNRVTLATSTAIVLSIWSASLSAQTVQQMTVHSDKAVSAAKAGQWGKSVAALEQALKIARQRAPLEVRKAVVVNTPQRGLGVYEPAPNGALLGHRLAVYVEVANFGLRPLGALAKSRASQTNGAKPVEGHLGIKGAASENETSTEQSYEVNLEVEGTFFQANGKKIGTMKLGSQRFDTRTVYGVTSFGVDVKLAGKVAPGTYRLKLQVTDHATNKRAYKELKFLVR